MDVFNNHKKIALQLSGGKDSLTCLYLLEEHIEKFDIYFLNTGDAYPETLEMIEFVSEKFKPVIHVYGNSIETRNQYGPPSNLVPSGFNVKIQDRIGCCFRSIMLPMYQRMKDDGVTLVIRGQKNADKMKSTIRSGDIVDGTEFFFPIQDWTDEDVFRFLKEKNVQIPRYYEMLNDAPDCMGCTGWWEKNEMQYLKRYHPEQYKKNFEALGQIQSLVEEHIIHFNRSIS